MILLSRTNCAGAVVIAERMRLELAMTRYDALPPHVTVTASFGIVERRGGRASMI